MNYFRSYCCSESFGNKPQTNDALGYFDMVFEERERERERETRRYFYNSLSNNVLRFILISRGMIWGTISTFVLSVCVATLSAYKPGAKILHFF
jgi:hypothetical protein